MDAPVMLAESQTVTISVGFVAFIIWIVQNIISGRRVNEVVRALHDVAEALRHDGQRQHQHEHHGS